MRSANISHSTARNIPRNIVSFVLSGSMLLLHASVCHSQTWSFHDQERIVFLGDALVEQEQYDGQIELALTTAVPDKTLQFRNLGWSADTPNGASRAGLSKFQAGHEPADEGWKQLAEQIHREKPSVTIFGYGMAAALDGSVDVAQFKQSFQRLIDELKRANSECRFIFLAPIPRRDDDTRQNTRLAEMSGVVAELAQQTQSPLVTWDSLNRSQENYRDPIHLSPAGYRQAAAQICAALGLDSPVFGQAASAVNPGPWEPLRELIIRKNQWYFHRSRPANMAYVFGFRNREQGQNAVEIPQFDALIAADEQRIAAMRKAPSELPDIPAARVKSKYAQFTAQDHPEFTVQDGFEVSLWAENPQLNKPIHMNFDPQGRLWVASSEAYPMIEVGQAATDKIIVLEDSNGDGKADRSQVFADDLLIPTGVLPGNGGVYVAQSTDLLFLADTDGDGKADQKQRVLSGFGTEDTHHNLHTLKWGPDGRLYMNQSVYTRTDLETPLDVVRLRAGGGLRLDPHALHCDIFFRGLWNAWGHQTDRFGNSFLTDGAGFDGIAYTFPGARFNPTPGARDTLRLISPGKYPKFASAEIIYDDAFPESWQGSLVTCDFRANRVTRFSLQEEGAGFATQQQSDLLRTSAAAFRPIDVKLGPDGALYVADWSNPIINHGEVDFRDPRRDRWHGRIWRVKWTGAANKQRRDLSKSNVTQLLDLLTSPDRFAQESARRVLIERFWNENQRDDSSTDSPILAALGKWIAMRTEPDELLQALWLMQALGQIDTPLLDRLLQSDSANVRAAATRVLADWADKSIPGETIPEGDAGDRLARLLKDEHPRVRLEAIRALARFDGAWATLMAVSVIDRQMDDFLTHALGLSITEHADVLMADLLQRSGDQQIPARQLEFVLSRVEPRQATEFLTRYFSENTLAAQGPWIELVGQSGNAALLDNLLNFAVADTTPGPAAIRSLKALTQAQRLRNKSPANKQPLANLLALDSEGKLQRQPLAGAAAELAGLWKLPSATAGLIRLSECSECPLVDRNAAVRALAVLGSADANRQLESLANDESHGEVSQRALIELCGTDFKKALPHLITTMNRIDTDEPLRRLWRGVLDKPKVGNSLAGAVASGKLNDRAARIGVLVASEGRTEPALMQAFNQIGVSPNSSQTMSVEDVRALAKSASEGDAHRGELTYRRMDLACVACHAIGGVGGKVGPDLSSIGASAPVDYIAESLFFPDAKIKEGYHAVTVVTDANEVFTGIEVSSDASILVLRKANGETVDIPTIEIVAKKKAASLMPTGVIGMLPKDEQRDLIYFLSQLGKPGEFDSSRRDIARNYQLFAGTHRFEQSGNAAVIQGASHPGWKTVSARVNGALAKADVIEATKQPHNIGLVNVYVRTEVQSPANTDGSFQILGPKKADVWIDGKSVTTRSDDGVLQFQSKLAAGPHTIVLRLDAFDLPDEFRLVSPNVTFASE